MLRTTGPDIKDWAKECIKYLSILFLELPSLAFLGFPPLSLPCLPLSFLSCTWLPCLALPNLPRPCLNTTSLLCFLFPCTPIPAPESSLQPHSNSSSTPQALFHCQLCCFSSSSAFSNAVRWSYSRLSGQDPQFGSIATVAISAPESLSQPTVSVPVLQWIQLHFHKLYFNTSSVTFQVQAHLLSQPYNSSVYPITISAPALLFIFLPHTHWVSHSLPKPHSSYPSPTVIWTALRSTLLRCA